MGEHNKDFWKGKVVIAYPHNGNVRQEWHYSVLQSWLYDMSHDHHLIAEAHQPGLYIAGNRNANVKQFLGTPAEWCWMQDTDHEYPPDTLYKLLEVADPIKAPIVSALYFGFMAGGACPMWFNRLPSGEFSSVTDINTALQPQSVDCVGMGSVLIHRSVFTRMEEANFDPAWKWFGHDLTEAHGWPERMGEDMSFFERVYQLGIPVWGDARVCIGHKKTIDLNWENVMKLVPQRKPDEPINKRVLRAVV